MMKKERPIEDGMENDLEDDPPYVDIQEENVVRIFGHETFFMEEYGERMQVEYPDLHFEFVDDALFRNSVDYMEQVENLMKVKDIDIVIIDSLMYREFIEKGEILYELDHLIRDDSFQLPDYSAHVIDFLRSVDGSVYGLSPSFRSSAIYYNKSIFDQTETTYPHDQMTWNEVFQLAEELAIKKGVFGMEYPGYLSGLVMMLGITSGLDVVDENLNVILDNQEWKDIWRQVISLYDSKVITGLDGWQSESIFIKGEAAMIIAHNDFLETLDQANLFFEWGLAPEPTFEDALNESPTFIAYPIYSISLHAPNIESAWKVIQYIHSSESARRMLENDPYLLVSRQTVMEEHNNQYIEAFYSRKPSFKNSFYNVSFHSPEAMSLNTQLLFRDNNIIFEGEKRLEDALRDIKNEMEDHLRSKE